MLSIPTNVPVKRIDKNDLIYKSERKNLVSCFVESNNYEKGQPGSCGTALIENLKSYT